MGSTFDQGSTANRIATGVTGAASGGLQAANGQTPTPIDFNAIAAKFKKKPASVTDTTSKIPKVGSNDMPAPGPDYGVLAPQPMPKLYSDDGAIPMLRRPFYGAF